MLPLKKGRACWLRDSTRRRLLGLTMSNINLRRVDALEAKAEAFDRLGRREQANECRKLAETIRRELWEQRATASVRAQHPFFHRRGPYE